MGIIVLEDTNLPEDQRTEIFDYVAFLVLSTLFINGTTCSFLLKYLKYDCINETRKKMADQERARLIGQTKAQIKKAQGDTNVAYLVQWDIVEKRLKSLEDHSAAEFAEIRVFSTSESDVERQKLRQSQDSATNAREKLLADFHAELNHMSHACTASAAMLLSLKDSCDQMIEGGELCDWWNDKLEPEAEKNMTGTIWRCLPDCCNWIENAKLGSKLKAIELCLGFQGVVAAISTQYRSESNNDEFELNFVIQLELAGDAARVWQSKQPAELVAMAETETAIKETILYLERAVDAGSLDEKTNAMMMRQIRKVREMATKQRIQTYNELASRNLKQAQPVGLSIGASYSKNDSDSNPPFLESMKQ
jgi:hypothetical protein